MEAKNADDLSSPSSAKRKLAEAKQKDEKYEADDLRKMISQKLVAGAVKSVVDEMVIRTGIEEKLVHK